jgi:sulfate adenylyltransferase subunit 2
MTTPARALSPLLRALEAESLHILRETAAECARPVLLYSIGKDSAVLLHLARKAFGPGPLPLPLLHVDTTWKFRDMYALRDRVAADPDLDLIVHRNPEAEAKGVNPFDHGSSAHTDLWKTQGLKQALDAGGFDAAFGGARRDEDASRAKERVFSVRTPGHGWDPRRQRPELWDLYNARLKPGETLRVFPLSNWTEADVWDYVLAEDIPVAPLYLAADRPTVVRDGKLLMVDDDRMRFLPGETPVLRRVRFRTLGCWPLTAAVESDADTLEAVAAEARAARTSERAGRLIDKDRPGSMERKKQEGYF